MSKKWVSTILAFALIIAMLAVAFQDQNPLYDWLMTTRFASWVQNPLYKGSVSADAVGEETADTQLQRIGDETLVLWYADDSLTEYITTTALSYQAEYGIKVKPVLVSGVEYLEQINRVSVNEGEEGADEAPDLYITTHDNLMRAYLAGLAAPITDTQSNVLPRNYPQTALHAVSCDEQYVAYPLYYETNFFLYNKTYMANMAKERIEGEIDAAEGEAATEEIAQAGEEPAEADVLDTSDETAEGEENVVPDGEDGTPMGEEDAEVSAEVLEQLSTMIPATIDDILTFANNYDAPEAVEAVFKWDVSDIFYNYFFVGNYMDVGGENGDNNAVFNIYNQQSVDCLTVYQNLNQFFSIDADEVTYEGILKEFIEGKTVFTVATTDAIAKIEAAKAAGEFEFNYGVAVLPDISSTLKARGLSVTSAVAVNGYSDKKEQANAFAEYLSYTKSDDLYKKAGKLACKKGINYDNAEISNVMSEYEKSVSLPKMIEASNYWVQLEIAFTKVWTGSEPDETLKALSDTIGGQIDEIEYHIPTQESISAGAGDDVK
ncbi:MAG: sugar ABC transporter substrate-binding protein [Lachnospiraceae bacterium]